MSGRLSIIREILEQSGVEGARAGRLASFSMSALNGALIQARVDRNIIPLEIASEELVEMFKAAAQ